jgi:ATP-dependent helicase/nuclease subunit B
MLNIHTIAANRPFLETLVEGLLSWERERLADLLLLLPSRRTCLAARETFLRLSAGQPMLLPRLVPVGEPDEASLLLDPELEAALPPAIRPVRRRLLLTRLVLARSPGMTHEQAVRLAGELERFLDELHDEEVDLDRLDELVPADLAEHWQDTLAFLHLLRESWPLILAEEGRLDASLRRRRLLDALAAKWAASPPPHPVLAAGITGTIPSVARLLARIAGLRGGCVVVPALDRTMSDAGWDAVGPTHPQYGLKRLLRAMEVERAAVRLWPLAEHETRPHPRVELWSQVLRPAETDELGWHGLAIPPAATAGLALADAPDLAGEAVQIALRLREALETPGKRAILVTPSRFLGRRVAAELLRWGVRIDDSAGVPLDQSPPGTFLLLTAHLVAGGAAPVPLLAALKHPFAAGGIGQREFRRHVRALERGLLRGPRHAGGLDALVTALREAGPDAPWPAPVPPQELLPWLERLATAARPFAAVLAEGTAPLGSLLRAHMAFAEWLATDEAGDAGALWALEAGARAHEFVAELELGSEAAGMVPTGAYPALLAVLMGMHAVRPHQALHPRLAILGPLESRLVQADLVLVGGLNEGAAPPAVESGPWLNRDMRRRLGLPPVEQAIGFAAHDFLTLACAPEVVLSRAALDENGAPTTPSRWLARLEAVLTASGCRQIVAAAPAWAEWAAALDQPPGPSRPQARPEPRPPLGARPRELWASDVERLMCDPYAVYARRILSLAPLEPLDADPAGAERGQLIHAVLEEFVRAWPDRLSADPCADLTRIGRRHFALQAHRPQVWAIWWPRFERIAAWFCDVERRRHLEVARIVARAEGALQLDGPGGGFRIRARADRVEIGHDGRIGLVHYRTGPLPRQAEIASGLAPRIVIEALIAESGGFAQLPAAASAQLLFLQLKGGDPAAGEERHAVSGALPDLLAQARIGLARLVAHFDDPATPYVPVPRPEIAPVYSDYEHLARVGEWWGTEAPS